MAELKTTKEVMEALGGYMAVAQLTRREPRAAHNWRKWPHFPPDTYVVMQHALRRHRRRAPISLWRMIEPIEK